MMVQLKLIEKVNPSHPDKDFNSIMVQLKPIKPHWEGQLDLLASNYELFIMAKNKVKEDGLMVVNRFGNLDKHPLLAQIKDSNIQCCKLINEFGLSPKADSKIKSESNDDADYLDTLMNG